MKYDLCCLGSAIVDLTFQVNDDFVKINEERGILKGSMTLMEKEDQQKLINELNESGIFPQKACGGSATNSAVAASMFGSECFMTCIVENDENGRFYLEDLSKNGVDHKSRLLNKNLSTGQCLIMISEDAERTMCTNLGINAEISSEDIDENTINDSKYILLEGYQLASPGGYNLFKKVVESAKKSNTKIALSLSDSFIVNSFREALKEIIGIKCDLIFCNENEAMEFCQTNDENNILETLKTYTPSALITKGAEGCVGFDKEAQFKVPGIQVEAIDTNGAGDMFAGAVLHELCNARSLEESAKFGCFAASKTVQNSGPRLTRGEYKEIKKTFSSY